jgi:hypothetical protein
MMTLDWLIIGGGIHGVHIAARLLGDAKVCADRLRIVDPGDRLLSRWRSCTSAIGMTHLRSPSVHHLGLDHGGLQRFARKRRSRTSGHFALPFERPSLSLFNAHCDQVEKSFGLGELQIRNRAVRCSIDRKQVGVRLESGRELGTQNLVLALGSSEEPEWPDWAPRGDPRVQHIFGHGFDGWPSERETVVVVGGGISAGHVVLRLLKEGHRVHLVSRHALRQHQFDSDPGWLGWKYTSFFSPERNPERRREVIRDARNRGSVSPDIGRSLRRAIARDRLQWHEGEVEQFIDEKDGLRIRIDRDTEVSADRVFLATGFTARRPGGSMVDELITSASLPCARCGYPIVDSSLRWHPRIYVSGPLAELELGPVSRNIAGARRAGDRIVDAARSRLTPLPALPTEE